MFLALRPNDQLRSLVMSNPVIIAVVNQKGGVGKTTTAVNLAAALIATQRSALLVDLDPQGNATTGSGVDKFSLEKTIGEVLLAEATVNEILITDLAHGYDLLPASRDLTAAEVGLLEMEDKETRLKQALSSLTKNYDFIIIDCPPSLSMLTLVALMAATHVLIPMQCEYYALEGLTALLSTIDQMKQLNTELKIEGIVRTLYDPRNRLTRDVEKELFSHFDALVYDTVIPRNVRLAEAPSYGQPILQYDKQSQGAAAYLSLAAELVRRVEGNINPPLTRGEISAADGGIFKSTP